MHKTNHRKYHAKVRLLKDEQETFSPMKPNEKNSQIGIAFNNLHEFELSQLANAATELNFKIMQSPSDYFDILVSGDNELSGLLLLGLARGAAIVKPAYIYESVKQKKALKPAAFEVCYFPNLSERTTQLDTVLKDLRFAIDVFPKSSTHPVLSDPLLENLLQELGGTLVKHNSYSDFIISDKDFKHAHSTVYKKVDYRWLYDSLLSSSLKDINNYFF